MRNPVRNPSGAIECFMWPSLSSPLARKIDDRHVEGKLISTWGWLRKQRVAPVPFKLIKGLCPF